MTTPTSQQIACKEEGTAAFQFPIFFASNSKSQKEVTVSVFLKKTEKGI
jgi:hypothetical protein